MVGNACRACDQLTSQQRGGRSQRVHSPPVFNPPDFPQSINLKSLTQSILFVVTCLIELTVNGYVRCCPTEAFEQVTLRNQKKFMSVLITGLREILYTHCYTYAAAAMTLRTLSKNNITQLGWVLSLLHYKVLIWSGHHASQLNLITVYEFKTVSDNVLQFPKKKKMDEIPNHPALKLGRIKQ